MIWRFLADAVLVLHLCFTIFVGLGGLLVMRWPRVAWVHIPAAAWGALIMFGGWICPLTPLENHFRQLGGQAGYEGGFIDHYIVSILYPEGLTRGFQIGVGLFVLAINGFVYGRLLLRARRRST